MAVEHGSSSWRWGLQAGAPTCPCGPYPGFSACLPACLCKVQFPPLQAKENTAGCVSLTGGCQGQTGKYTGQSACWGQKAVPSYQASLPGAETSH